jgi:putative hydrolase of the HAD superfamily
VSRAGAATPWAGKTAWVFDLDNTLYPAECDLFAQIDARMTSYVASLLGVDETAARALQKHYLVEHGTTLNGLMTVHGADPAPFLDFVHDIDLTPIAPDPALNALVRALPGQRIVFTNGSRSHAERVISRLGLDGAFHGVFDIEASAFTPKPKPQSFHRLLARHDLAPAAAVMFEDLARNLEPAAALGFTTVLVRSTKDWSGEPEAARPAGEGEPPAFVHYATDDLKAFLAEIIGVTGAPFFTPHSHDGPVDSLTAPALTPGAGSLRD